MRSLYDEVFDALTDYEFSIPNVTVRKPFDETAKTYPAIIVHEIVNRGISYGTVTGETHTALSYQLDIQTQNCVDEDSNVLTRWAAGRLLVSEVTDLLDDELKITRRRITPRAIGTDVLENIWRGDAVLDAEGYAYRP